MEEGVAAEVGGDGARRAPGDKTQLYSCARPFLLFARRMAFTRRCLDEPQALAPSS